MEPGEVWVACERPRGSTRARVNAYRRKDWVASCGDGREGAFGCRGAADLVRSL